MDKRLLESTEEQVRVDLDPRDAIKLVTRLRRVSLFIRSGLQLVTERDEETGTYRCYDMSDNIKVSVREAKKHLTCMVEFNELKREALKAEGRVRVTRLGGCLFIG